MIYGRTLFLFKTFICIFSISMQLKYTCDIFNLQPRDAISYLMTTAKVSSSLVRFSLGPVAFARVLPRQHEQVVRESPMVPGWIP